MKVTVFGTGAWGTTMAQVLVDAGNDVLVWGRNHAVVAEINGHHTNRTYLEQAKLPDSLRATSDIEEAFSWSDFYVLAIPAQNLRSMLMQWQPMVAPSSTVVSTLKGIEVATQKRMSEIITELLHVSRVAIVTGPNLADELILRQPAGAVAASDNLEVAELVQKTFRTTY